MEREGCTSTGARAHERPNARTRTPELRSCKCMRNYPRSIGERRFLNSALDFCGSTRVHLAAESGGENANCA
eukprot:5262603-Pleurochrysis_carterae.AAC.4